MGKIINEQNYITVKILESIGAGPQTSEKMISKGVILAIKVIISTILIAHMIAKIQDFWLLKSTRSHPTG